MNKSDTLNKLDAIATERLFGVGPWLVNNPDASIALTKTLQPLGLEEPVPNAADTTRLTNLGKQLNFDLYQIFVGLLEPWDAIMILEIRALISEQEAEELFSLLELAEEEYEPLLRARIQRVYREYYQAILLH